MKRKSTSLPLTSPLWAYFALPNSPTNSNFSANSLPTSIINVFLPAILAIAGFMTALFIVISGIQFITSSGDPKGADAAKQRLTYAIVGFIVVILAFAALQIVNMLFLGTDIA